jgi:hypothetical protein
MTVTAPGTDRPISRRFVPSASTATGALLLVTAVLTLLQAVAAFVNDKVLIIVAPDYVYQLSLKGWGWVHIVIGVLLGIVAFGLIFGAGWARPAAIAMAGISIISMFLWLPYYPTWALIVIALDVIVIWGVATWDTADTGYRRDEPSVR